MVTADTMDQPRPVPRETVSSGLLRRVWSARKMLLGHHRQGRRHASGWRQDHMRNAANSSVVRALADTPFPLGIRLGMDELQANQRSFEHFSS
jgi:hypothetical protein